MMDHNESLESQNILKVPPGIGRQSMNSWVEESIWGHRFISGQTPWFVLIELLNICAARMSDRDATQMFTDSESDADPVTGQHESFTYAAPKRVELRHILFRDNHLDAIADKSTSNEKARWNQWIHQAENESSRDLGYLKERFTSFEAFVNTVRLMRSLEAIPDNSRSWTARHLMPHGPAMLMAELKEKSNGRLETGNRNVLGRGGEMMFLMLNRSDQRNRLEPLIKDRLLSRHKRWNRFAERLQPAGDITRIGNTNVGYLPWARHPRYNRLAEDWIALLETRDLPTDYILDPLMRTTGLHAALYMLERAAELKGSRTIAPLFLAMMTQGVNSVRKLSTEQFHANQFATRVALTQYLEAFRLSDQWQTIVADNDGPAAKRCLFDVFGLNDSESNQSPEHQFESFRDTTIDGHQNKLGTIPNAYLKKVGIALSRPGAGSWYTPYDGMLETLVLANVRDPVELRTFVQQLYQRYTIVIGPREARQAFGAMPVREEQLVTNLKCFEQRLSALGLIQRLSDDCAFVHNPFIKDRTAA